MHDPSIKIVVSSLFKSHTNVELLWNRLGIPSSRLMWWNDLPFGLGQSIVAKELMLFPCVAPHYHPFPYQRSQELLRINLTVPITQRKKLLYLTRRVSTFLAYIFCVCVYVCGPTSLQSNSRGVKNEDIILERIRQFLKDHNRPEELVIYESGNYPNLDANINLFNYEAR